MAIELKEYVGAVFVETKSGDKDNKINLSEGYTQTYVDKDSLMVDIEAIHSIITRNDTLYTEKCIKDSIPYWTAPYERPVIMHHNEKDGKIIGRVKAANYIEKSERSGTAALELIANIGDEEGKKGIKNGTLATVSIGAIAHDIRCSICGTNLVEEGMCEHDKGEIYDGKRCYWIVNKIEPKEVSYVIVPSDIYAHNTRVYDAVKKNKNEVNESMSNIFADLIEAHGLNSIDVTESKVEETKEGTQVEEEVKDGAKVNESEKAEEQKAESEEESKKEEEKSEEKKEEEAKQPETEDKEEGKDEENKDEPKEKEKKEAEKVEENKELEEAKEKIAELTAKVETLTAENIKLSKQVETEKALKESAEAELITFKTERKKTLIENVNSLRTQLSLPAENVEHLMESSEEALNLTIKSLTEFIQVQKKSLGGLSVIESPVAVSDEKDNTNKEKVKVEDVKESVDDSNNEFEQSLLDIMQKIF